MHSAHLIKSAKFVEAKCLERLKKNLTKIYSCFANSGYIIISFIFCPVSGTLQFQSWTICGLLLSVMYSFSGKISTLVQWCFVLKIEPRHTINHFGPSGFRRWAYLLGFAHQVICPDKSSVDIKTRVFESAWNKWPSLSMKPTSLLYWWATGSHIQTSSVLELRLMGCGGRAVEVGMITERLQPNAIYTHASWFAFLSPNHWNQLHEQRGRQITWA